MSYKKKGVKVGLFDLCKAFVLLMIVRKRRLQSNKNRGLLTMINNNPYQLNQQTDDITPEELFALNAPGVHVINLIPRRAKTNSDELTGVLVEVE